MGHATTGRLLRVPGCATQRAGAVAQARSVGSCRARHSPFGPAQKYRTGQAHVFLPAHSQGWARERRALFCFCTRVSLHDTVLFSRARERACCARFCFFLLLVQVFDHLAWNIMSTSFDLKLDPPNSKCYLILYPSYKYFDIILLLLYLFLIFILNRF
jgi:hypothetical protein